MSSATPGRRREVHKPKVSADDLRQAIFGAGDGACDALGITLTLWLSGHRATVAIAALGAGVAASTSMAGNEYISDPESSIHRAVVMGAATLLGALWIGGPFFLSHGAGSLLLCVARVIALGAGVAWLRAREWGWNRALLRVYTIFAAVSVLTAGAGLITG